MRTKAIGHYFAAFFIFIFALGTSIAAAQTCAPPPVGLIVHYSGDGNALDARSRNNGTPQGNISYVGGGSGQAFQLGGNNGDRIVIGNPVQLRLQDFTIEAWVKRSSSGLVTNSPNGGSPAGILFAYGQGGYAFLIDQNTNKLGLSAVGSSQVLAPTLTITDTNWHHVAVTQSGPAFTAGTQAIFYLDGVADTPANFAPPFSFTTNAAIGSRGDGQTDNVFFGAIDELSIYDRALSAAQIAAIAAAGTAGKCKPLATNAPDNQILWLAGDGDAIDLSSGGTNGTLQNGVGYGLGKVSQGFTFDGVDDQITVPDSASQNGGMQLSIEAWIKPTSLPHGGTILQKRTAGNSGGYVFEPTQPSGSGAPDGLQFVIMIGGVYHSLNPANVLTPNVWQHVAATYDGAFMRIYVNGVEVGSLAQTGAIDPVNAPVVIGKNVVNTNAFVGSIDEIGLYNRALTAAEVQSIANAGIAGKYKVQATVPSAIAAWYPGDGNTNDLVFANTGTLLGGATYAPGKVGSAFSMNGTNAYVTAPSTTANDPTGAANGASMEAWIYLNQLPSAAGRQFYIMSKNGQGVNEGFDIHIDADNGFKYIWGATYAAFGNTSLQTGQWYHLVMTFSSNTSAPNSGTRTYINGTLTSIGNVFTPRVASNVPLTIGREVAAGSTNYFNGLIDEPAVYNRTLTPDEVRDQYYAGSGGKYKGGAANTAHMGDATVTFGTLANAISVQETPLDPGAMPAFPMGITPQIIYDIAASGSGTSPTVCFNTAGFTAIQFNYLRIYHLESGVWQNRTAMPGTYPNLCSTSLPSLSPVAIVQLAPTAAAVSLSGRVTLKKNGLGNVTITVFGGDLVRPLSTRTNGFGYYKFDGLAVGQTYVVSASSKQYSFSESMKLINLMDDVSDADFIADVLRDRMIRMK